MKDIQPGSVTSGTLRAQDLLPRLMAELKEYNWPLWSVWTSPGTLEYVNLKRPDNDPWWNSEEASDVFLNLIEVLDDMAPPGYYFGAHPEDGANFGFWPINGDPCPSTK